MEKVQLLLTDNLAAPTEGAHIIIEAEAPTRAEAAAHALDMALQGPYPYVFAIDDEGDIPTTTPTA